MSRIMTVCCDGCGADVDIIVPTGQQIIVNKVYCPGCTKLNAAKAQYAQQAKSQRFQTLYGGTNVAYQRRGPHPQTGAYQHLTQQGPQCSFTWDMPRMAYAVTCQYQPNFIEFIKAKIPVSDRAWDPTTKTWYIKDPWFGIMHE